MASNDSNKNKNKKDTDASKQSQNTMQTPETDKYVRLGTEDAHTVTEIPHCDYDVAEIDEFLTSVFHVELLEDENILCWASPRRSPGYPISESTLLNKKLNRAKQAMTCYYSTATTQTAEDGKLYNRQALFKRLHAIVLDDIGTKIKPEDIPDAMTPTYIIESSKGNFQYGYVFDEPIDDLDIARALVQVVYRSGLTDEGGAMPNKLVRLPCGVNGKKGEAGQFRVRLVKKDGPLWTPENLLDVLDAGVTWKELHADAENTLKRHTKREQGMSLWSPVAPSMRLSDRVIDPVLEYLYETDKVKQESTEWFTIQCPWHHEHTNGDDSAGYSPLGYGTEPGARAFHCFHGHCAGRNTAQFLGLIAAESGIEVPVFDPSAELVRQFAYIMSSHTVFDIRNNFEMPVQAFNNVHSKKVPVVLADGTTKAYTRAQLWHAAPHRLETVSLTSDHSTPARIVEDKYGAKRINLAEHPDFGKGSYDAAEIDRFMDYLTYLIPVSFEREYFLDWLAAKVQNPVFRGCAVLMIAKGVQGTGRTTLAEKVIAPLLGRKNVNNASLSNLALDDFNEWAESLMVVVNEVYGEMAKGGGGDVLKGHRVYENLKDIIDPQPREVTINPKYGARRTSMCCTSFLMFSNHADAMHLIQGDRRFFVLSNPLQPRSGAFFTRLNEWLDKGECIKHIYRWLHERCVNMQRLTAPPPTTEAKQEMHDSGLSTLDIIIEAIADITGGEVVSARTIKDVMDDPRIRMLAKLDNYRYPDKAIAAVVSRVFPVGPTRGGRVQKKVDSVSHNLRFTVKGSIKFADEIHAAKQTAEWRQKNNARIMSNKLKRATQYIDELSADDLTEQLIKIVEDVDLI